ncbi:hypothetical protein LVD15_14400 [Fulvivirga maritima]|uniref:hypothetical protein n=1 Tax=Fulvivirga maritima TaxID=2904247 RepID=UPI001F31D85D|nr:hypothetical protein [Fulvivirga maritima]UII24514.1 hypothetical protein LVD15_14400 [Fulvivirga maritima]
MKKYLLFICVMLWLVGGRGHAQEKLNFGDTGTTNTDPTYSPRDKDYKKKRLVSIVKTDTKGLLLGNKCMKDVTTAMGFEYIAQPKGQPGHLNEFARFWHNFGAKITIFFKNGPLWKFKLKKKRKECRQQTGDFTG